MKQSSDFNFLSLARRSHPLFIHKNNTHQSPLNMMSARGKVSNEKKIESHMRDVNVNMSLIYLLTFVNFLSPWEKDEKLLFEY